MKNKANKIYLERLRKNDFADRFEEPFLINGMTFQEYSNYVHKITKEISESYKRGEKHKESNPFNMIWNGFITKNP